MTANSREFGQQEDQFLARWDEEVDVIVMDRYAFSGLLVTQAHRLSSAHEVVIHDIFRSRSSSHVRFKDVVLRDHFNKELLNIKRSGEYERIVEKYIGGRLAAMFKVKGIAH